MIFSASIKIFAFLLAASTVVASPLSQALGGRNNSTLGRRPGRGCSTTISPNRAQKLENTLTNSRLAISAALAAPGSWPDAVIDVYFHVVVADETYEGGWVPREQLALQLAVLNEDYAGSGLSFRGRLVTRIVSPIWFYNIVHSVVDTRLQDTLKAKYRKGDATTLNVYLVSFSQDETLGYATFPHDYDSNPSDDGVVVRFNTLPLGELAPYNIGRTLTHEAGHWLGLYHPFQGGCTGFGDGVDDTSPQDEQTAGCPAFKDTCPGDGPDNIQNFMDYSDDACLTNFTPGQFNRLRLQSAYYRGIGVPPDFNPTIQDESNIE